MSNPADEYVKPGDVLDGKYLVEKVLGAGGMGIVVQARHKTLNKRVAIKFMRPDQVKDGESVARFQREAKAAASLQSEHTARVQDTGRLESGAPYMVMEFLIGKDLGQVLEETGPMRHGRAVELVLQACEALAEAHARNIVHRDIKPRNLFLAQTVDGRPLIKVLDFGLAKDLATNTDHALTATTAVMGSPQYMSPEQMRASRDVDRRTDIWSIGVCLYELLTGKMPFDAPTVPMLCALVLKEDPTPPHLVNRSVPLPLSLAVMRCVHKEPAARFFDVADLADVLEPLGDEGARGAAARVRGVLSAKRAASSDAPPPAIPIRSDAVPAVSGASFDNTLAHGDTRTAASFDSKPMKERTLSNRVRLGLVMGAGVTVLALSVVVGLVVRGSASPRTRAAGSAGRIVDEPPPSVELPDPGKSDAGSLGPQIPPIATVAMPPPTSTSVAAAPATPQPRATTAGARRPPLPLPPIVGGGGGPKPTAAPTPTANAQVPPVTPPVAPTATNKDPREKF